MFAVVAVVIAVDVATTTTTTTTTTGGGVVKSNDDSQCVEYVVTKENDKLNNLFLSPFSRIFNTLYTI